MNGVHTSMIIIKKNTFFMFQLCKTIERIAEIVRFIRIPHIPLGIQRAFSTTRVHANKLTCLANQTFSGSLSFSLVYGKKKEFMWGANAKFVASSEKKVVKNLFSVFVHAWFLREQWERKFFFHFARADVSHTNNKMLQNVCQTRSVRSLLWKAQILLIQVSDILMMHGLSVDKIHST